jgi:NADP-dependent 3-hydroxy acid dehydrogenase YdfG
MTTKLNGKVALITGASAGIGQACARALAEEGARLVLTARRQERLNELQQQAEKLGTQAISVLGDAREESTAKKTVEAAMQTFGQIDILINNTGVGNYKNLVNTSAEEYDDMMDTNVRSTFLFTRHTVPVMLQQKQGTILMISSMAGVYGFGAKRFTVPPCWSPKTWLVRFCWPANNPRVRGSLKSKCARWPNHSPRLEGDNRSSAQELRSRR